MKVFREPFTDPDRPRGAVLAIGNFDGVHLGHRRILESTVARARELGAPSAALTFEPHPVAVLAPQRAPARIQSPRQKIAALAASGLEALLVVPFTRDFSLIPAAEFVRESLVGALGVRAVVIGGNFCFGHGRGGNLGLLEALGRELGFRAEGVDDVPFEAAPVSSSRIREAVRAGEVEVAAEMLGRPFALFGWVTRGDERGRQLGFPTINLSPGNGLLPARGVYVGQVRVGGERFAAVVNVGVRPTVADETVESVEAHLLDFSGDLYGREVEIEILHRLRDERRFGSLEELAAAITRDVAQAREWSSGVSVR